MGTTSQLGNYQANRWLQELVNTGAWLAMHTDDPTATGIGSSELIGNGYGRQFVSFTSAGNKTIANNNAITFVTLPESSVPFLGFWDAITGGNFIASIYVSPAIQNYALGQYLIAVGDLALTLP